MGGLKKSAFLLPLLASVLFIPVLVPFVSADNSFPLSPGNTWTYRDLDGNEEVLIIHGAVQEQGVALVEASYTGRKLFYYLVAADGIGRLEPLSLEGSKKLTGELSFLISWPLDPGNSWSSPWSDPPLTFTVLERGPVTVAAGTFRHAVRIGYRPGSDPIYLGYFWFVPGVGLVVQEESANRVELVRYSLTELLPPAPSPRNMSDMAGLFHQDRSGTGEGGSHGKEGEYSLPLTTAVGSGVLLMMILALAAYIRSVRVDVELEDDPQVEEGEAALASAMVRSGLYSEAAQILQGLTSRHPQWPDIAALLGSAYRESGQYEEACIELKRALTLNPEMATARLELVRAHLDLDDPVHAMEEVEVVLGEHGEFADAIYLKGKAFAAMGEEKEAVEAFRKALSINPSFEKAQEALEKLLAE
jgi:tetratricopeptide (TPR) repeat protein